VLIDCSQPQIDMGWIVDDANTVQDTQEAENGGTRSITNSLGNHLLIAGGQTVVPQAKRASPRM